MIKPGDLVQVLIYHLWSDAPLERDPAAEIGDRILILSVVDTIKPDGRDVSEIKFLYNGIIFTRTDLTDHISQIYKIIS